MRRVLEFIKSIFAEPCTLWPNQWGEHDWSSCCKAHDDGYDEAELSYDRAFFRLLKDEELRDCANEVMPGVGDIMFFGLRIFNLFGLR